METNNAGNNAESKNKTTVFHLIILDESGSMSHLTDATISGCNETLQCAKLQQEKYQDKQNTFISIYVFQSGAEIPSRYLVKNAKAAEVRRITKDDYCPQGLTPLYDAVGSTLIDLEAVASTHEDAHGIVTIITDGRENSSNRYRAADVARIIDRLKERGWIINFIGAGIDVTKESNVLHIDGCNAFRVDASAHGITGFYAEMNNAMSEEAELRNMQDDCLDIEERIECRKKRSMAFWKKRK